MAADNEGKHNRIENSRKQRKKRRHEQKVKSKEESEEERKIESKEAEETKSSAPAEMKNKPNKKRKLVFPFGNYKNYYGYRIGPGCDGEEDPRIKVLKMDWFEGKDCLDIGCNSGIITIQIAKKYNCRSILGVDIDSSLVEDAFRQLRKIMRKESAQKKHKDSSVKVVEEVSNSGQCSNALSKESTDKSLNRHSSGDRDLSNIVSFRRENFVHSHSPPDDKYYDTILCLSVTKWIHLNFGDDGLINLFAKVWRLLNPGGVFVLEPQPWESYGKNRRVSETTSSNYQTITIRPEHFQDILLDKIGFRKVEDLTSELSDTRTGFDRPIFAFHK